MGKMWIRQVKAIRNDGNASTIDLQQGLNCIIGPSNTGKTGITKTISFVCGGNVIPFTDVTGYAGASVTFSTEHGEVTLQRSLASQTIQVSSTDSDVEPGDYTVARRGKNKRPINSVLLTMLDVDEARRIAVNEAYRTVAFTWNAIRHLLLVPEDQIVRPEPSILLPKTTSNTTMTQNLSALLVLAQDETFNDEARQESSAERHARRQAVERFIFSQLDIIEPRIKQLEQLERDAAAEGKTVDSYIEKLRNTLQQLEQQRRKTIDEDAELVEHISALHQENERLDVLLAQRETLLGQYDSDLARLDLQLQAMRHNREQPYPDVCQFCHSTVHIDPPSEEDIRARENEMSRIRELRNGVAKDQESLRQARIQVTQSIDEAQNAHQSNMEQLHRNLEPEARTIRQRLDGLAQSERIRAECAELTALRKRFQATLDGADEEKVDYKKYRPREWFHEDFYYRRWATVNIRPCTDTSQNSRIVHTGRNIMPEPSKSDSECIAGLELPKQDNAHAPHPVSAAIIYAGVFTVTCALYSSILSACWGFLLIILPGYAIVPFIALLLTRKINASWNLLWLAGTTALTYAMTLVSMAALLMLIPPKATLWFSVVKILTNSFSDILSFQLFMGGYTIPTIFYILGLICRAYHNSRNR
ncbi:hypothetical protein BRUM_0206 [Bifidobacterium ruminantium]|uniref:Rad50/SbcC-type AAA domain-containing protein n=2 Tax=Bifidobacterium ruminantium TaxID=78346 RepID=A0A087D4J1_BIFRU|nr:hypothetical protein BRUM_0206 [Bifidobacterium ruminantium]